MLRGALVLSASCGVWGQDLFLSAQEAQTTESEQKWVKYASSDCGYDDIPEPWCDKSKTVDECKAMCLAREGCGGFNYPHGVLKKVDCATHIASSTVDLYVLDPPPSPPPPGTELWPLPRNFTKGTADIVSEVVPSSTFFSGRSLPKTITDAFARYEGIVFPHVTKHAGILLRHRRLGASQASITGLDVTVESADEHHPQLETDESYELTVPASGLASLSAKTIYGALHGLETFSQLVKFNFTSETYGVRAAPWKIQDAPRFAWRGLMVDTSRHFQSIESIKEMLDSLAYAKINVMHWHMSDSQSFPMQSKSSPKLWEGSWSPQERYLQAEITDVVEYARARGIRVLVEFDMPGHAASWCKGYPEVCPSASCNEPLNVASNATWSLIENLLAEVTGAKGGNALFKDEYVHLGGDEVNTGCWTKSPEISAWLKQNNMTADQGYAYFVKRAAQIVLDQGHRPVQWVEVFDHFGTQLDKKTVVHVWKDKSTLNKVVADGYNALINNSPGSNSWYLDHLNIKWDAVYGNEPCETITDPKQCALILGGQGEMWGETVDASDFQSTVWPKLAAIAERLWSPRDVTDAALASGDALRRIETFRCLLTERGVKAAPVTNANARTAPPGPGSCFSQ